MRSGSNFASNYRRLRLLSLGGLVDLGGGRPSTHTDCNTWRFSSYPTRNIFSIINDYILITNLMHWSLFIHKILYSSTCFEPQVLIFRRIQLYTCSIWYCHSLWLFLVACRYTAWVWTWCTDYYLFIKYYIPLHVSSLKCSSSGGYSCIRAAYGIVTLYD